MDVNPDKQRIKINFFIFNTATRTLYQSENVGGQFFRVKRFRAYSMTESFAILQIRPQYLLSTNNYHGDRKYRRRVWLY